MSKYSLLIFDWDGTLIDSKKKIIDCMQSAISTLKLDERSDKEINAIIGMGLDEAVSSLYPDLTINKVKETVQMYREISLKSDGISSQLFKGAKEVLSSLKRSGYYLSIATNKSRRGLDKDLIDTGMEDLIPITRCADETRPKPHPQMLEEILIDYNINADQALMIGDSVYDLQVAKNTKVDALAVSYGVHSLIHLLKEEPVGFIDNIDQLPKWLDDHS